MEELTPLQRVLWLKLLEIPGMEEGESAWGDGPALWVNARQVANFTNDGTIELRLTRLVIRRLKSSHAQDERLIFRGSSDWLGITANEADFPLIVELAAELPSLYLPPDGTAPKPPPTGAAMARRKRFH